MGEEIHSQFNTKPSPDVRSVNQVLERADQLKLELPYRVLKFDEDWDLIILADEIKRLRNIL